MKLDHYFFHLSKLSEDQKKIFTENWGDFVPVIKWKNDFYRKLRSFCPQTQVTTKTKENKVQRSSSAQMQIIVKLLKGYIPPTPRFRHPDNNYIPNFFLFRYILFFKVFSFNCFIYWWQIYFETKYVIISL